MSDSSKAVFLSYASQDAEVAKRICDALRAAGVEVWFDQSELRGGDAWDALIRKRIKECALFVPVISPNTQARAEGYFRLEWKLAVDRSHLMADDAAFLFPVVIGDLSDATARVPDKFRDVQWTRLRLDETPAELGLRVARLLSGDAGRDLRITPSGRTAGSGDTGQPKGKKPAWLRYAWAGVGILFALVYAVRPLLQEARRPDPKPPASAVVPVAPVEKPAVPVVSEARQLAMRARAMSFDKYDSTSDDFAAAEGMLKHALELDPNDAEIWAASSQLNKQFQTRGFDRSTARATATVTQAQRAVKLDPDSIEAQFALGYAERGTDPAAAEKIMRWILTRRPDHPGALFAMSNLTFRQGKVDESLGYLQEAAKQPKWAALAGYLKYLTYFSRARFAEADQAIRQSIAVQPSANSVAGLAMVLLAWKGDAEAAARVFAEAPTTMRNEPRTVWMTAQVQLCRRAPDEALNALDRLQDDYIQDSWFAAPKAYYIGRAQALAGRPEAAKVAWEAGLAIMQDRLKGALTNPGLHLVKGELLALLGRDDEALREARTVAELSRGEKLPWFASPVRIYAELGRADEALPLLAGLCPPKASDDVGWPLTPALLRLDPLWDKIRDDPRFQKLCEEPAVKFATPPASEGAQLAAKALALITKVGFTRDDLAPAEDFARRATEKEPDSAAAWGVRAGIQSAWLFRNWDFSEKRRQDTQAFANRALALDPNEPEALLALGHLLRQQGAFDQAEALLRRAVAANPDHVRLARSLAYTMSYLPGREAEALALQLQILQRTPNDPLLRYETAMSYGNYGRGGAVPRNLAAGIEQLDAAIAIQPFSSALILKAVLIGGWRGDLPAMRAVLDQADKLPLAERAEDRSVYIAMWAGLMEHRSDRVEAAAALTARNYMEDSVMPLHPKAWWLALAHGQAGKMNSARNDWSAAEAVLRQRIKDDPVNLRYQIELATTLAWLDQREEAARLVAAVEPVWRENPEGRENAALARYYAALGDAKRAVSYLAPVIDGSPFLSRKVIPLDPWWDKIRSQPEFEALLAGSEPAPAPGVAAPVKVDDKSIAVLPFENMSADKDSGYFADGIQEDILTNLAHIRELRVVSRTSVAEYRATTKKIPEIARELGVTYILEGSVRRAGNKVRVTGQLIRAAAEEHVWAESMDRDLNDIFAIQSELAEKIATSLQAVISPREKSLIEKRPTENTEAYDAYLKARAVRRAGGADALRAEEALLHTAVTQDPNFAAAWADLTIVHADAYNLNFDHSEARLASAKAAIDTAVRLAPDAPEVVRALGEFYFHGYRDYTRATKQYEKLIRLQPNDPNAYSGLGFVQRRQGRWADSLANFRKALELDPGDRRVAATGVVQMLSAGRRYAELVAQRRQRAGERPDDITAFNLALAAFALGGSTQEVAAFFTALPEDRANDRGTLALRCAWADAQGDFATAVSLDEKVYSGANARPRQPDNALYSAMLRAARGDVAGARALLEAPLAELKSRGDTEPTNARIWSLRGQVEAILGHRDEALRCARRAIELVPESIDAYEGPRYSAALAFVQAWTGEKDQAIAIYARLLHTPFSDFASGFSWSTLNPYAMRHSARYAPLHGDPRFEALLNDPANNAPLF